MLTRSLKGLAVLAVACGLLALQLKAPSDQTPSAAQGATRYPFLPQTEVPGQQWPLSQWSSTVAGGATSVGTGGSAIPHPPVQGGTHSTNPAAPPKTPAANLKTNSAAISQANSPRPVPVPDSATRRPAAGTTPAVARVPSTSRSAQPPAAYQLVDSYFDASSPGQCVAPPSTAVDARTRQTPCPTASRWHTSGADASMFLAIDATHCLGVSAPPRSGVALALEPCTSPLSLAWKFDAATHRMMPVSDQSLCVTGYADPHSADHTTYLFPCSPAAGNQNIVKTAA